MSDSTTRRPLATHSTVIRVRYPECDPMGVAHHAAYPIWLEIGRTEMLRTSGGNYRDLEAAGVFLAVVRLEVRYRRPARYDDELRLETDLVVAGPVKIEHAYRLFRGDELLAEGATTLACLDREAPPGAYEIPAGRVDALLAKAVAACDAVILSDYAKGILNDTVVARVSQLARKAGKFIALDPKPKRNLAFHGLDLITPNKRESLQLAGMELAPHARFPAAEVCARLHERYATRHLVVTLGEEGMLLSANGRVQKVIPTAAREVFDVSGAGDTALAGLVLALCAGAPLETAAHFANAAAGVVVGKLGTATVSPTELVAYVNRR